MSGRVITVHISDSIKRYVGDTDEHSVDATTITEAFESLFESFPEARTRIFDSNGHIHRYLLLFHNEVEVQRDALNTPVANGDKLEIVAAIAGGKDTP